MTLLWSMSPFPPAPFEESSATDNWIFQLGRSSLLWLWLKFVMALVAGADSNSAMPAERLGPNIMAVVSRDHQCR